MHQVTQLVTGYGPSDPRQTTWITPSGHPRPACRADRARRGDDAAHETNAQLNAVDSGA